MIDSFTCVEYSVVINQIHTDHHHQPKLTVTFTITTKLLSCI